LNFNRISKNIRNEILLSVIELQQVLSFLTTTKQMHHNTLRYRATLQTAEKYKAKL